MSTSRKRNKEPKNYKFIYECFELSMRQSSFIPTFHKEYRFCNRYWKIDYAWVGKCRLAVEIEGGLFIEHKTMDGKAGGHNRGSAMLKDIEKYNEMAIAGFYLLRFTPQQIEQGKALLTIERWFKENHPPF